MHLVGVELLKLEMLVVMLLLVEEVMVLQVQDQVMRLLTQEGEQEDNQDIVGNQGLEVLE
jgi:hypothetical protein